MDLPLDTNSTQLLNLALPQIAAQSAIALLTVEPTQGLANVTYNAIGAGRPISAAMPSHDEADVMIVYHLTFINAQAPWATTSNNSSRCALFSLQSLCTCLPQRDLS